MHGVFQGVIPADPILVGAVIIAVVAAAVLWVGRRVQAGRRSDTWDQR